MVFKVLKLIKLYKTLLTIFEFEWFPDTMKEQTQKQMLVKESWELLAEFTQVFHLDKIK